MADPAKLRELADKVEADLLALLNGEYSSLTIGFNDSHACNYVTAKEYHDRFGEYGEPAGDQMIDWVTEAERQKALTNNTVWTAQWYPASPVGFHCIGASSFAVLLEELRALADDGDG